ncbi:MAG: segregation/condensation protein A [Actinobacteria bacterium]|nr:segregation/condensation protein A [Actinomycetota bacterium]
MQIVEKEEMDITQVSLAKIANQYIEHINGSGNIGPDEMADFLVVAARLLLIKSKALLPYLYPEEEEEIEELELQLKMYKEFLEAMKGVEKMIGKKKFMFAREFNRKAIMANINLFSPPKNLKTGDLKMIFQDLLGRVKPPEKLEEEKLERKINIEDKIRDIRQTVLNKFKTSFSKILGTTESKTEVIVTFLAMLELIKQRDIVVDQEGLFREIVISKA